MIFSAVFVILPLLLIVVYAFMDDAGHFTLGNFAKFFAHPEAINTFVYSIGVAIITTVVCILLGYPAAYILTQMRMKLYSDTDADEICIDSGGIVYFAHVGEYFNTYTGYGGLVRFYERIFRRGGFDIRYGI